MAAVRAAVLVAVLALAAAQQPQRRLGRARRVEGDKHMRAAQTFDPYLPYIFSKADAVRGGSKDDVIPPQPEVRGGVRPVVVDLTNVGDDSEEYSMKGDDNFRLDQLGHDVDSYRRIGGFGRVGGVRRVYGVDAVGHYGGYHGVHSVGGVGTAHGVRRVGNYGGLDGDHGVGDVEKVYEIGDVNQYSGGDHCVIRPLGDTSGHPVPITPTTLRAGSYKNRVTIFNPCPLGKVGLLVKVCDPNAPPEQIVDILSLDVVDVQRPLPLNDAYLTGFVFCKTI